MTTEILYFLVGLIVGGIIAWLMARLRAQQGITEREVQEKYVVKELYENLEKQWNQLQKEHNILNNDYVLVSKALSAKEQYAENILEKLRLQNAEFSKMQDQFTLHFENIASRLLEEKSQKFTEQNHSQLHSILVAAQGENPRF